MLLTNFSANLVSFRHGRILIIPASLRRELVTAESGRCPRPQGRLTRGTRSPPQAARLSRPDDAIPAHERAPLPCPRIRSAGIEPAKPPDVPSSPNCTSRPSPAIPHGTAKMKHNHNSITPLILFNGTILTNHNYPQLRPTNHNYPQLFYVSGDTSGCFFRSIRPSSRPSENHTTTRHDQT